MASALLSVFNRAKVSVVPVGISRTESLSGRQNQAFDQRSWLRRALPPRTATDSGKYYSLEPFLKIWTGCGISLWCLLKSPDRPQLATKELYSENLGPF